MGGSGTVGNYTMYVNPFMVVQNFKYTKHFYIEGQRIVSKLGEMGVEQNLLLPKAHAGDSLKTPVKWDGKKENSKATIIANFEALGLNGAVFTAGKSGKVPYGQIKKYFRDTDGQPAGRNTETMTKKVEGLQFYYHPDHLGSSNYITDASGEVYQHQEYFPFGETFIEERNDAEYTTYLFNGKELDEETGLYYYGARYYEPRISLWISVDPMAEKMKGWSPYSYTFNNPLRFIDIDGFIPWPILELYNNAKRVIVSGMYRNSSGNYHGAVDIAHLGSSGQISGGNIKATHTGVVEMGQNHETMGNYVIITNGDIRTRYMHLDGKPLVKNGQKVNEGDDIGKVGSTGRSEAPHLHYQIQKLVDGKWEDINPVVNNSNKVNTTDNVDLKDPQKMIDERSSANKDYDNMSERQLLVEVWKKFQDWRRENRKRVDEDKN